MKIPSSLIGVILGFFVLALAVVLVREGAELLTSATMFVGRLFHTATHRFNTHEGFVSAILFVAICVFPAWAYSRFRKTRKGQGIDVNT